MDIYIINNLDRHKQKAITYFEKLTKFDKLNVKNTPIHTFWIRKHLITISPNCTLFGFIKTYLACLKMMMCLESIVFDLKFFNVCTVPRRTGSCSSTWLHAVNGSSAGPQKFMGLSAGWGLVLFTHMQLVVGLEHWFVHTPFSIPYTLRQSSLFALTGFPEQENPGILHTFLYHFIFPVLKYRRAAESRKQ